MFRSDDECSGLADVYIVKGSERSIRYTVVNEVWHIESILYAILPDMGNQCNILRRVVCSVLCILSVILVAAF